MPNRARKPAKKPQGSKKAPSTPVSAKTPAKPEDPVATFLARLGKGKDAAAAKLDPAQRRELARRAARVNAIAAAKASGEPKKR
jgi:hypothetical protein